MTVTLELTLEETAALENCARAGGVDIQSVLHSLVAQIVPLPATEPPERAAALMYAWRREEETDDPEERAEHDREREELKANMDRWRAEQGRPSAY